MTSKATSCLTKPLVKLFRHPGLEIALSDWGHGGADMVCFFEGGIRTKEMSKNVAYVAWSIFVVICLFGSVLYLQNFNRICDPDSLVTSFLFLFS